MPGLHLRSTGEKKNLGGLRGTTPTRDFCLRKKGTEGLKLNYSNFSLLWPASFSLTYLDIIFIFDLLSESVIPNRLTIVRGLTY